MTKRIIPPYSDFINYIYSLDEYKSLTADRKERIDLVIQENESLYHEALSGSDLEKLYTLSYRFGGTLYNFLEVDTFKELAENIYGVGVCEKRAEQQRKDREEKYKLEESQRVERERQEQLGAKINYNNQNLTIKDFIDYKLREGFKIETNGKFGIGTRYKLVGGDEFISLNNTIFRKKYVIEYLNEIVGRA